jgi:hypothetical protein
VQRDIQSKTRSLNVILFYLHLYPPAKNQKEMLRTVHPLLVQVSCHTEDPLEFT